MFVYIEDKRIKNEWFDLDRYYDMEHNYNNEAFIAKMWAAKEMASMIFYETMLLNVNCALENLHWLTQFLKKEWFR